MYHIFIIQPSIDEHLDGFHFLAVVNRGAIKMMCNYLRDRKWSSMGMSPGAE